jgi:hypothetical protein
LRQILLSGRALAVVLFLFQRGQGVIEDFVRAAEVTAFDLRSNDPFLFGLESDGDFCTSLQPFAGSSGP